jgi:ribosomal protein S18 acetylase RimI-like enzyme
LIQVKGIRKARSSDLRAIIEIDALITRVRKPAYWKEMLRRYGSRSRQRFFLVAATEAGVQAYIIGEVRDWEFGSPSCGWVFDLAVHPRARLSGVGTRLLEALCQRLRESGVDKVRTLLARDNALVLAFFRSQGMMAAPLITLEKELA